MTDLVLQKEKHGYNYIRSNSKENNKLSHTISEIYDNKCRTLIVPSGMNAISTLLSSLCVKYSDRKINIVYSSELYCDTSRLICYLRNQYGFTIHEFDILNNGTVKHPYVSKENIRFLKNGLFQSVFTLKLRSTKSQFFKKVERSNINLKTSFGDSLSRFDPYPQKIDDKLLVRISIGYSGSVGRIYNELLKILN